MLSSANYRGFIATWKIENDKLYLTYIDNEKSKKNQMYKVFGKKGKEAVFADWFSGVIVADNFSFLEVDDNGKIKNLDSSFSYYIYVRKGFVQNYEKIPIFELANKGISPTILDYKAMIPSTTKIRKEGLQEKKAQAQYYPIIQKTIFCGPTIGRTKKNQGHRIAHGMWQTRKSTLRILHCIQEPDLPGQTKQQFPCLNYSKTQTQKMDILQTGLTEYL